VTGRQPTPPAESPRGPILSLFPGIDLLGRAFEMEGFCVVRGPDLIWGQSIEGWHVPAGVFPGVIGGSPCQDFSAARRAPPSGEGMAMLSEFARVVTEAAPDWWLLENVPGVPDVAVPGYTVQRFNVNAWECGSPQNRLRRFQFGHRDATALCVPRPVTTRHRVTRCAMASEGQRQGRREWADFCELQGLPRSFTLPGWSRAFAYRAVGNGVPILMGRVLARAIRDRGVTPRPRLCVCECGRPVTGRALHATPSCRKRLERARRRRDRPGPGGAGPVTPGRADGE
jgi:DNA (cytosine-5)-methyltransferase 1